MLRLMLQAHTSPQESVDRTDVGVEVHVVVAVVVDGTSMGLRA